MSSNRHTHERQKKNLWGNAQLKTRFSVALMQLPDLTAGGVRCFSFLAIAKDDCITISQLTVSRPAASNYESCVHVNRATVLHACLGSTFAEKRQRVFVTKAATLLPYCACQCIYCPLLLLYFSFIRGLMMLHKQPATGARLVEERNKKQLSCGKAEAIRRLWIKCHCFGNSKPWGHLPAGISHSSNKVRKTNHTVLRC